jgi:hypothetical protein
MEPRLGALRCRSRVHTDPRYQLIDLDVDMALVAVQHQRDTEKEVAPTSSGETFVGAMVAARAIADGRKAVFLLPYRALVSEKYEDFSALG